VMRTDIQGRILFEKGLKPPFDRLCRQIWAQGCTPSMKTRENYLYKTLRNLPLSSFVVTLTELNKIYSAGTILFPSRMPKSE
jgi:hypothetical protein